MLATGKGLTAGDGGATFEGLKICLVSSATTERGVECPDDGGLATTVLRGGGAALQDGTGEMG